MHPAIGLAGRCRRYHDGVTSPRPEPALPSLRALVVGDLVMDVVMTAATEIRPGTDVPGRVQIRQGGSAANAARWLARLGVKTQLVCAVGRDGAGRSLVDQVRRDGVVVRALRVAGHRTGRIGVLVLPSGERSFIADRRAADQLRPDDLRPEWFAGIDIVHLPAYSMLGDPLGRAGWRAVELARSSGAKVSFDLASIGPLLAGGRRAARRLVASIKPDVLFATEREAEGLLGRPPDDDAFEQAALVILKRGSRGASVIARVEGGPPLRFDVATPAVLTADTTGAGDAFDAGFIARWLAAPPALRLKADTLHRATLAGHRAAARHLGGPRPELPAG
jgi:sugar/nucleoside kinase (ribokinase family)